MRVIMVMFDSLNRHHLPAYGCDWTHAPNFARLAQRTATFDQSYVCSMPCMPARRDLHTGRPNFLHRSWGPLEPFDDSVPQILRDNGIHTHLATDHYHYFEDGGATYHTKYSTWEFFRGQEGDPWIGQIDRPLPANGIGRNIDSSHPPMWQDRINRQHIVHEHQWPQSQTFRAGMDYVRRNAHRDNWFLQIETFDPHEPFFSHRMYKDLYAKHYDQWRAGDGPLWDWPPYDFVKESRELVEHMRYEYASLLSMCDRKMGDVLDMMDELDMWKDTMLIVWTDHGFLLGEHDMWAKVWQPFYQEIANTPFFVWDPRPRKCGIEIAGQRRQSLVQPSIDLGPTLLDAFGLQPTRDMLGRPLRDVIASDKPVRQAAMFGINGGHLNVTDGRYVYMRAPVKIEGTLNQYTLMPTHMRGPFAVGDFARMQMAEPFGFMKGARTMRIPREVWGVRPEFRKHMLWDLKSDPGQTNPISDAKAEAMMLDHLMRLARECEAPPEMYERLGLK